MKKDLEHYENNVVIENVNQYHNLSDVELTRYAESRLGEKSTNDFTELIEELLLRGYDKLVNQLKNI